MSYKDKNAEAIYRRENYEWLKDHHLCTICKSQDAYTLMGRARCYECALKNRERKKKWYHDNFEKQSNYMKERYNNYKREGICTRCHKRQAQKGYTMCNVCKGKSKKHYYENKVKSYAREDAVANGMCHTCLKEKVKPGYKVCEKCYNHLIQAGKKADRNYWRALNNLLYQSKVKK